MCGRVDFFLLLLQRFSWGLSSEDGFLMIAGNSASAGVVPASGGTSETLFRVRSFLGDLLLQGSLEDGFSGLVQEPVEDLLPGTGDRDNRPD